MMNGLYSGLIAGALAGALRSVMGWLGSDEKFNPRLFIYTLIKTLIIGASIGYMSQQTPIMAFFQVYTCDTLLSKGIKIKEKRGS